MSRAQGTGYTTPARCYGTSDSPLFFRMRKALPSELHMYDGRLLVAMVRLPILTVQETEFNMDWEKRGGLVKD